jgi:hypothetical protein
MKQYRLLTRFIPHPPDILNVLKETGLGEGNRVFYIAEVYIDNNGIPKLLGDARKVLLGASNITEAKGSINCMLEQMREALKCPILDADNNLKRYKGESYI